MQLETAQEKYSTCCPAPLSTLACQVLDLAFWTVYLTSTPANAPVYAASVWDIVAIPAAMP